MITVRSYSASDLTELLALLRLNTPRYFDRSEEKDFVGYLHDHGRDYYVVREDHTIVGGGGVVFNFEEFTARIAWDFFHPLYQGRGLGKLLTDFRIRQIRENPAIRSVLVRTSQHAFGFYAKMDFRLEKVVQDYWAKGFDLYEMRLNL